MRDAATIHTQFADHLYAAWRERYAAAQRGEESAAPLLPGSRMPWEWQREILSALPAPVRAAYEYYDTHVQQADWGTVALWKAAAEGDGANIYAVHVTTDGDDGWLELYAEDGGWLGGARRYLELLAWDDDVAALRALVASGDYPPALDDRATRTLWGK